MSMQQESVAKIVSYNLYGETVCACAAKISTTKGSAYEIFQMAKDQGKDRTLIQRVLGSGHRSIIEHAVFTIALENVSAFVEQFFIEFRLASFTVKSRRYVDFSGLGYCVPEELSGSDRAEYQAYMELLFQGYQELLDRGIPKEDARFLLPYAFHSHFYCTINARELVHVLQSIKYGRGRGIPELQSLADQLIHQLEAFCPSVLFGLFDRGEPETEVLPFPLPEETGEPLVLVEAAESGKVRLLQAPADPKGILEAAYPVGHPGVSGPVDWASLLHEDRPRELEQLNYTFQIADLTLSGVTHIVRHRMQSILIPPLQSLSCRRVILPETVRQDPESLERYRWILERAAVLRRKAGQNPQLRKYSYYYLLSGTMTDLVTTMNAREAALFLRLRTCNRAQWEIRQVAVQMLGFLRESLPEVFRELGPSCYMDGRCPEGRLTCGEMEAVCARFRQEP